MRLQHYALVALLGLTMPTALYAQATGNGTGRTGQGGTTATQGGGTATTPGGTTTTSTASSTSTTGSGWLSGGVSHWIASGFVGANVGNNSDQMAGSTNIGSNGSVSTSSNSQRSADFGASLGYLWRNIAGAEFVASFTPNFQMQNTLAPIGSEPNVNSYMANAIGAVPLGGDGQWAPYVSGGFGAITLRGVNGDSNTSSNNGNALSNAAADTGDAVANALNPDETRAGGNIGVGLMAFLGNVGVRGDVRYFRAFENDNNSSSGSTSTSGTEFLPGLTFWRANVGVAFRW